MSDQDDERIARFLDGAMSAEERADFERDMEQRPELALQAERWRANDERLKAAFELPLPEGMAERLGLAAPAAPVIDLAAARERRAARRLPAWTWAGGAIAASLIAALSFSLVNRGQSGDLSRNAAFQVAMQQLPSSRSQPLDGGGSVTPTLSFVDGSGRFCREFAVAGEDPQLGVACRDGGAWRVEGTSPGSAQGAGSGGYRTAEGADTATLDPIYERLHAGDPLDPARERELIGRGWQNSPPSRPGRE
ncbi:MAG TPA: hypothetical protein VGX37_10490 [Allosphingosinicella sp.]|nr:hypothetical protein [Allosphingosinicella sp.]